jgi:hypothetical protein
MVYSACSVGALTELRNKARLSRTMRFASVAGPSWTIVLSGRTTATHPEGTSPGRNTPSRSSQLSRRDEPGHAGSTARPRL